MLLGIFGGTFNPIHFGHLRAAEEVRDKLGIDKVIFMPSGNPPLKGSGLIEAFHRYDMTRLATSSNVNFAVSDLEILKTEKSYTVETFERLLDIYPGDELFFILGLDAFLDMPNWWQPERLSGMVDFVVVTRPGSDPMDICKSPYVRREEVAGIWSLDSGKKVVTVNITPMDISSTNIRKSVKEGKSIKYLLPETVEQYIYSHKLYSSDA